MNTFNCCAFAAQVFLICCEDVLYLILYFSMYEITVTFGCVQNWSTLPHFTFRKPQSCCSVSTITDLSHHSREICAALCPSVTKVQVQALGRVIISLSRRQTGVGIICLQPLFLSCVGVIQDLWRGMEWALLSPLSQFLQLIIHRLHSSRLVCPLSVLFSICAQRSQVLPPSIFLFYLFTLGQTYFLFKKGKMHMIFKDGQSIQML